MGNGLSQITCEPSRPLYRLSRLTTGAESACLAAEMQQLFHATAFPLIRAKPFMGFPQSRNRLTTFPATPRRACMLETLLIGVEKALPVVSDYVNEYQRTSGKILPTRVNIHYLSGSNHFNKTILDVNTSLPTLSLTK